MPGEVQGGDHSEGAWAARMDPVLRFLFPPPPPRTAKIAPEKKGRSLIRRALSRASLVSSLLALSGSD